MTQRINNEAVAALVGRRIDTEGAKISQFPLAMVPTVKIALSKLLRKERVRLLICSAACGADLLALDIALKSGIRCRVILPFDQVRFRQTSVVDRPGDWGSLFDRIIPIVDSKGDLVVLGDDKNLKRAYQRANEFIVEEAAATSYSHRLAILVWEGRPRLKNDATAEFRCLASAAGMLERTIPTLCS